MSVQLSVSPAEAEFYDNDRTGDYQDGSAYHPKRDPRKGIVSFARLAGIFPSAAAPDQKKSKVSQVACLAAKKILCFGLAGCVGAFGSHIGETLILARPFVFALVIIAETNSLALLCGVGKGQTDG